jgi:iron complex transport system substrate-binding protein
MLHEDESRLAGVRVVSLLPSATDVIAELGLLDDLVGISDDCDWPPEVLAKPLVARTRLDGNALSSAEIDRLVSESAATSHSLYAVDADLLDELRPDLIVTQDLCVVCAVSSDDLTTACPVGTETYSMNPRTLDDVIESVVDLGRRLGAEAQAREVAARMRTAIDETSARVAGRKRKRVFVAEWVDPPFCAGHWLPEMVEAAGGEPLLGKPGELSFRTTWDEVLAADPELVVVAACGFTLAEALPHVRGLRLPVPTVVVDGDAHFSRPAPRLAEGVRQLAHLLHPDAAPDPGLPFAML